MPPPVASAARPGRSDRARRAVEDLGVFKLNKETPFHRWVSLTEGFSARLVAQELGREPYARKIYDPFGGTGTTPLVAAQAGRYGTWAEVNPYLREVAQTKAAAIAASAADRDEAVPLLQHAADEGPLLDGTIGSHPLVRANESRDFFDALVATELVGWVRRFERSALPLARQIGRLAVASCAINVSKMKRAVDLRRRTPKELAQQRPLVAASVRSRLGLMVDDLLTTSPAEGRAVLVSDDARSLPADFGPVDLVVTSPPYLNGTNYCRNTKLELLLLGIIENEDGLKDLRSRAITAGINNVSQRIRTPQTIDAVERIAQRLDERAYDQRIPAMVRAYFSDMQVVLSETRRAMSELGKLVLDIGDSRFAGVHVDTPELLLGIAETSGWRVDSVEVIRSRVAKDGNPLCQKLLRLYSA